MDARAYEMMAETEDRHWWWAGRRTILRSVLRSLRARGLPAGTLYDLGCGVGSNLPVLGEFGPAVGIDGSELAVGAARERGRSNVHLADLAKGRHALDAYPAGSGSVVLLADVLEHLDDEYDALAMAHRLLAPGGAMIATVPAFPFLWSASDEFNHHRRRYTRETLAKAVKPHFAVERMSYFNFWLFGPIVAARTLSKLARRPGAEEIALPPAPLNLALRGLFASESALLARADLPFGVSLLCVARKS